MKNISPLARDFSGTNNSNNRSAADPSSERHIVETVAVTNSPRHRDSLQEPKMFFSEELPAELLQQILITEMSIVDIANCAAVCNFWRENAVEGLRLFLKRNDPLRDEDIRIKLAVQVRTSHIVQNFLMDVVKMSRGRKDLGALAAKAITLLNTARISFSMQDFTEVHIPGALLEYAVMDGTNLSHADLTGVRLNGAWLRNTDFSKSILTDVQILPWTTKIQSDQHAEIVEKTSLLSPFERSNNNSTVIGPDGKIEARFSSKAAKSLDRSKGKYLIEIYDKTCQKVALTLEGHEQAITSVAFSMDSKLLASGSHDGTIKIWDLETGECWRTLTGYGRNVGDIDFSPDNRLLTFSSIKKVERHKFSKFGKEEWLRASEKEKHYIYIWDVKNDECLFAASNLKKISKLDIQKSLTPDSKEFVYEWNGKWRWHIDDEHVWLKSTNNPFLYCEGIKLEEAVGLSHYNKDIIEWHSLLEAEKMVVGRSDDFLKFENAFQELLRVESLQEIESVELEKALGRVVARCNQLKKFELKGELLERTLTLKEKRLGVHHAELIPTLYKLVRNYGVLGNISKQKDLLYRILAIEQEHVSVYDTKIIYGLLALAEALGVEEESKQQDAILTCILDINQKLYAPNSIGMVKVFIRIGRSDLNDIEKQRKYIEYALNSLENCVGDHKEISELINELIDSCSILDPSSRDNDAFTNRLVSLLDRYGESEYVALLSNIHSLSQLFCNLNMSSRQIELLNRALNVFTFILARSFDDMVRKSRECIFDPLCEFIPTLQILGKICMNLVNSCDDEEYHEEILSIVNRSYTIFCTILFGLKANEQGLKAVYAHLCSEMISAALDLGSCLQMLNSSFEAISILERMLFVQRNLIKEYRKTTAGAHLSMILYKIGKIYYELGDLKKSEAYLEEALTVELSGSPEDIRNIVVPASLLLARNYAKQGDVSKQTQCLSGVRAIAYKSLEGYPIRLAGVLYDVSDVYLELGDSHEQKTLLKQVLDIRQKLYQEDHPKIAKTLYYLAEACLILQQFSKAKRYAQQVVQILKTQYEEHFLIDNAEYVLEICNEQLDKSMEEGNIKKRMREVSDAAADSEQGAEGEEEQSSELKGISVHRFKRHKGGGED